jgi:outer membrane protein OmpA-like peptidoglycan-associated protein
MIKWIAIIALALVALLMPTLFVLGWVGSAKERLEQAQAAVMAEGAEAAEDAVAVASAADVGYCTPELKRILRRVLQSCGLLAGGQGVRGCQPVQARNVATMAGPDFNALFLPMAERGGIVQFDRDSAALDEADLQTIDRIFSDQRGASWFFVVARASPEGSIEHNRTLSQQRAEAVMSHLRTTFRDPDLEREVGLLWLGEEFAQLDRQFCDWERSGTAEECNGDTLNRSAFIAWIDCTL